MHPRLVIFLVLTLLPVSHLVQAKRCTVYVYLDDEGNTLKTRSIDEVPDDKRASLVSYKDDCKVKLNNVMAPDPGLPAEAFNSDGTLKEDWDKSESSGEVPTAEAFPDQSKPRHSYKVPGTWVESRRPPGWLRFAFWLCFALILGGTIGVLVEAWRHSILWFLGVLLIPLVWLIFSILAWRDVKVPFIAGCIGYVGFVLIGLYFGVNFLWPL